MREGEGETDRERGAEGGREGGREEGGRAMCLSQSWELDGNV